MIIVSIKPTKELEKVISAELAKASCAENKNITELLDSKKDDEEKSLPNTQ